MVRRALPVAVELFEWCEFLACVSNGQSTNLKLVDERAHTAVQFVRAKILIVAFRSSWIDTRRTEE